MQCVNLKLHHETGIRFILRLNARLSVNQRGVMWGLWGNAESV